MTSKSIKKILCLTGLLILVSSAPQRVAAEDEAKKLEFFEKRIRPVLIQHCYKCHSKQTKSPKGGLRLDLRSTSRKGGDSGAAVVPGKPDKSLLIKAVRYQDLEMPPKGKLPARVIADLVQWVKSGAVDPRGTEVKTKKVDVMTRRNHWAFKSITKPKPPKVKGSSWPAADLDRFVLSKLESKGLSPAKDANRYVWLRRVTFDLTGLPPTVKEISDFQKDKSKQAYARVVDRLLASKAFGERWARHWLDLVGYADQIGTSNNVFAEHGWRYRNYVIRAFNNDKPYNRFVQEQIAGDLIESKTVKDRQEALTATGFLLMGDLEIVEADKAKLHVDIIDQQVNKMSKAFLALTVGCARCHDHKFDPILQKDYYAFGGFFHSTVSVFKTARGVWSDVTAVELPETKSELSARRKRSKSHAAELQKMKTERANAKKRLALLPKLIAKAKSKEKKKLTDERNKLNGRVGQLNGLIVHREFFAPGPPRVYGVKDVDHPEDMRLTIRGNPRALGAAVRRGFLTVASKGKPRIPAGKSGRKELAEWVASSDNPLTARVVVNRIWQKLFGVGLVGSVDNFGLRGLKPTHPKLLDHLATTFIENRWSQKQFIRRLVLSRTYRMSSEHSDKAAKKDANNQLLWRMRRRRLDAESIRDALLSVSGKLKRGISNRSAIPLEYVENVANIDPKNVNPPSFRIARWRPEQEFVRTVYLPILRSVPQPGPGELRNVFDFTQPAEFAGERAVTAVPTQALFLMNSPVVKKHAANLADRIVKSGSKNEQRVKTLWLLTLGRPITKSEQAEALEFVKQVGKDGWRELCHAIVASNEFLMRL